MHMRKDVLLDLKQTLALLRTEIHNPGSARISEPDVDLDKLVDEHMKVIDFVLGKYK